MVTGQIKKLTKWARQTMNKQIKKRTKWARQTMNKQIKNERNGQEKR